MHVAFMGRSIRPQSAGVGRYAANLGRSLAVALPPHTLTVFLTRDARDCDFADARQKRAPLPTPNEYARLAWEQTLVPLQTALAGIDVFHSPNYILPAALPCRSVVTIHDLAYLQPELHRLQSHLYLRVMSALALRRADAVIAVSDYTRRAVEARYPHTVGRIDVVYEGVDPALKIPTAECLRGFRQRSGAPFPYILFVGTLEPRKNLPRLVAAFEAAVAAAGLPHHLVLIGNSGWKTSALERAVEDSPLRRRIHRLGYIPDADLALWYAGADVFAYPSLQEGFGLPALEAMAMGTPVVTSNCSSLPEVVGDAAITVNPCAVEELTAALIAVLTQPELTDRLRARGFRQASRFTWEEAARRHRAVYERVVEGGKH